MSNARLLIGDVFDVMATMPDASVDLIVTSPPFLALRSYLPADHPDKAKEIGSEPTPAAFIDTLLALTAEWRRLLAPHGSICVELGDTYSGSGGSGGDYNPGGLRDGQQAFDGTGRRQRTDTKFNKVDDGRPGGGITNLNGKQQPGGAGYPLPKSLCGIPHLYHLSLAYGRNILTGNPSPAGTWRIRNVVAWCRPNPPVGALGDKFRPATSYMTIACVAKDRYFDLDAVRQSPRSGEAGAAVGERSGPGSWRGVTDGATERTETVSHPAGAPPLDWWEIPTQPYAGSHYAVFPPALITRPIQAMCPTKVCTTCGEPSRRLTETEHVPNRSTNGPQSIERKHLKGGSAGYSVRADAVRTTTGWTDCGHDTWRTGIVLDPFAGSGTTLAVATGHSRDAIGIDLDERNADLARDRVGMFLNVETGPWGSDLPRPGNDDVSEAV